MTAPTIPTPQQPYFTAGGPRGWFVAFRATEAGETKDILPKGQKLGVRIELQESH